MDAYQFEDPEVGESMEMPWTMTHSAKADRWLDKPEWPIPLRDDAKAHGVFLSIPIVRLGVQDR